MNAVKFGHDQIQNGQLIVIAIKILLKLAKYLKTVSVPMNITNSNDFFCDFYTCIHNNPPINPVKFGHDQIKNGWLIAIVVCSNWHNIWKLFPSSWISQTPMNVLCKNLPMHILQSFHESCEVWSWSNSKWSTYCHCDKNIAQIGKIFKNCVRPDEYHKRQWIFFCYF